MQKFTFDFINRVSYFRQDIAFYKNHKEKMNEEMAEYVSCNLDSFQKRFPEAYKFIVNLAFHWNDDKEMRITGIVIEQLSEYLMFRKPTLEVKHLSGARWSTIENCALN